MRAQSTNAIYLADALSMIGGGVDAMMYEGLTPVVVTDPPFNIGYRYKGYKDRMPEDEYYSMLEEVTALCPSVIVHYPEQMHRLSIAKGEAPERVVSWVYNSNTGKQHRDIAFYGVMPDFRRMTQPYKNPSDKRIRKRIAEGKGARLYDWWNVNQVKNTTKGKTAHPCQMPLDVMEKVVGILPDGIGVIDPFLGSGTTALACKRRGVPFIGYEVVPEYYEIAKRRLWPEDFCVAAPVDDGRSDGSKDSRETGGEDR